MKIDFDNVVQMFRDGHVVGIILFLIIALGTAILSVVFICGVVVGIRDHIKERIAENQYLKKYEKDNKGSK